MDDYMIVTAVALKPGDILMPGNERIVSTVRNENNSIEVKFAAPGRRQQVWHLPPDWTLRIKPESGS